MGTFPYDKDFLPIVKSGDYVYFQPSGQNNAPFNGEIYQVVQAEPIQPYLIDFIQVPGALAGGATTLGPNSATQTMTSDTAIRNLIAVNGGIFAQYRIEPIDDILVQMALPGGQNYFGANAYGQTAIGKRLPTHKGRAQVTNTTATDVLLWANTVSNYIAAQLSGMLPTRKSRIVGLAISASGATNVTFGDAAAAGGATANAANNLFGVNFTAADFIFLGRGSIPEDLYFDSGVVFQSTGAGITVTVTVVVEEDAVGIFGGNLQHEERATANQSNEFFVFQNLVPNMLVINPTGVTVSTLRAMFAGYQFYLVDSGYNYGDPASGTKSNAPANIKPIGIPLQRLPSGGRVVNPNL